MKNAVGREIPDEILARTGKEVFKGSFHNDQKVYRRAANQSRAHIVPTRSKSFPPSRTPSLPAGFMTA